MAARSLNIVNVFITRSVPPTPKSIASIWRAASRQSLTYDLGRLSSLASSKAFFDISPAFPLHLYFLRVRPAEVSSSLSFSPSLRSLLVLLLAPTFVEPTDWDLLDSSSDGKGTPNIPTFPADVLVGTLVAGKHFIISSYEVLPAWPASFCFCISSASHLSKLNRVKFAQLFPSSSFSNNSRHARRAMLTNGSALLVSSGMLDISSLYALCVDAILLPEGRHILPDNGLPLIDGCLQYHQSIVRTVSVFQGGNEGLLAGWNAFLPF
mmetsp:Transcript_19782/g.56840  ORF Transcript_19782/g.56840 Transcript_19782/m.56840 type:complete len:266 (+) Transcript_19782:1152-1949(+)